MKWLYFLGNPHTHTHLVFYSYITLSYYYHEVSTLDIEEEELDADDGLLPKIAEGDKTHNVFSWDQLINDDSLNVDE